MRSNEVAFKVALEDHIAVVLRVGGTPSKAQCFDQINLDNGSHVEQSAFNAAFLLDDFFVYFVEFNMLS